MERKRGLRGELKSALGVAGDYRAWDFGARDSRGAKDARGHTGKAMESEDIADSRRGSA